MNSWGKGKAILIGSVLGLSYYNQPVPATKQLFLSLAHDAGVSEEVEVAGPGTESLEVRRLVSDHEQLLFAFNHSAQAADATISITLPWRLQQVQNLLNARPVPFETKNGKAVLRKEMAVNETWVVRLASGSAR
jgi:hypothetical protein